MKPRKIKNRLPPFVPLFNDTLDAPASKALSHGAFRLYVALKRQFNPNMSDRWNGRIYLSLRDAEEQIRSHRDHVARWYRELEYYGFIVLTERGCLGPDGKGKAPRWRLTELPYLGEPATKDFLRWKGTKFTDRKKQNPDPQKRDRVTHKRGSVVSHKSGSPKAESVPQKWVIEEAEPDPQKRAILSITTTVEPTCDPSLPGSSSTDRVVALHRERRS